MRSQFKDEHTFGTYDMCIQSILRRNRNSSQGVHQLNASFPHFVEKRKLEAERIRNKYPERIPVSLLFQNEYWSHWNESGGRRRARNFSVQLTWFGFAY